MKHSTEVSAEPPVAATTVASDQPSRAPLVGYAFAAIGAVLFSTKAIIIKLAYAEGINAETLLALRMLLSLPFYAAIGLVCGRATGGGLARRCRTGGWCCAPRSSACSATGLRATPISSASFTSPRSSSG